MMKFIIVLTIMVAVFAFCVWMLWREARRAAEVREAAEKRLLRAVPALKYHSFAELPVGVYLEALKAVEGRDPEDGMPLLLAALCGCAEADIDALTLPEYTALVAEADWVQRDPDPVPVKRRYYVGPWRLRLFQDFTGITFSQYIDLQELLKQADPAVVDILAVALVPEGHTYADGYELSDLKADLAAGLSILDALAIRDFFVARLNRLTRRFLICSAGTLKAKMLMTKNPGTRAKMLETLQTIRTLKTDLRKSGDGLRRLMTCPTLPVAVGRMLLKSPQ